MMRILVARPRGDAERTARALAARGHEAVVAPVMTIRRTDADPPPGPFHAAILTSANAVPALASVASQIRNLPIFAVGGRTAAAAADAGFDDVRAAEGDAASLSALIGRSLPAGARLLHVAGRERKPEPDASLGKAGFGVSTWTAYEVAAAKRLPAAAADALRAERLDAALHYSRRSAGIVLDLAGAAGLAAPFLALAHVCLSADAADPLRECGAQHIALAESPDEEALLTALDRCARELQATGSRNRSAKW